MKVESIAECSPTAHNKLKLSKDPSNRYSIDCLVLHPSRNRNYMYFYFQEFKSKQHLVCNS